MSTTRLSRTSFPPMLLISMILLKYPTHLPQPEIVDRRKSFLMQTQNLTLADPSALFLIFHPPIFQWMKLALLAQSESLQHQHLLPSRWNTDPSQNMLSSQLFMLSLLIIHPLNRLRLLTPHRSLATDRSIPESTLSNLNATQMKPLLVTELHFPQAGPGPVGPWVGPARPYEGQGWARALVLICQNSQIARFCQLPVFRSNRLF